MAKRKPMIFVGLAALVFIQALSGGEKPDYPRQPVPFTAVKITDRFWLPRLQMNRSVTIPHNFRQCEETGRIDNFTVAGGLQTGSFRSKYGFDDSDVYKNIEAAAYALQVQPDPKLDRYLDDLIRKIAAAQEKDGYLYTNRTIDPAHPLPMAGPERWSNEVESHELYNVGHLYEAAVAHFQATGKRTLLAVALKSADLVARTFGPQGRKEVPGHQEIEIGLVKLYRLTGEEKYLRTARFFLDQRGNAAGHQLYGEYAQDHLPVVRQTAAVGHAVRAAYMYSAMADIAALSGDSSYIKALDSIWNDVISKKTYLTGGIGSAGSNEGFAAAYDLPNETAYGETCAAIANALWNYRMFLLKGDAQYLDIFERVAYNGFLSGLGLSGNCFFYPNPLASSGQHQRQLWFNCACCPPNVARFLASLPGYFYAVQGQRIYVNLYARSESAVSIAVGTVIIRQDTDYPWNGSVALTVEPSGSGDFELLLRIPGWTQNQPLPGDLYRFSDAAREPPQLLINGRPVTPAMEHGFAKLVGPWRRGDRIQLRLPMPVRRVVSHEALKSNRGLTALQRGPLLYCAEWPDNNGQVKNLVLDSSRPLKHRFIPGLLGGVEVLDGKALALSLAADGKSIRENWQNFRAIPYFVWANRGRGDMAVWLASSPEYSHPSLGENTIDLTRGWKFIPGDNPEYARPDLDETAWIPFGVDRVWEEQGYEKLDGFAWHRLRVVIPSRLKEKAFLKDGLRFFLGKINNFDQTFLNGRLIGANNRLADQAPADDVFIKSDKTLYNQERCYILPLDDPRVLWDRENVIAVRVFDEGGLGGIYSGNLSLRAVGFRDFVTLDQDRHPFTFRGTAIFKSLALANTSNQHRFRGTFTVDARGKRTNELLWRQRHAILMKPGDIRSFDFTLGKMDQSAVLTYSLQCPESDESWSFREESPYILTPPAKTTPRLNGPEVVGARPGKHFFHAISASGQRPLNYRVQGLPPGLALDAATGIIQGRTPERGEYRLQVTAKNRLGVAERTLRLVIGDTIALTPPMGWNSWNCWGLSVDAGKAMASAAVFKEKGLLNHGWNYINIDDGWEIFGDDPRPKRDSQGNILTNEKFPDMKSLSDKLHALGLKFGIYSSPGPLTCGGYTGTYEHEFQDARAFADWGVDYLKYDWCSYDKIAPQRTLQELQQPYLLMRRALDAVDRDIVFSLCQYGMGKVWEWGAQAGGNLWRTTEDIEDTWKSMSQIGFSQVENAQFAGPGHWNDTDMLVVGWVGWGPNLHPTRLTPDEQYTHISLWCLLSAPLLIGCDLERLDPFTLNLLCNDEVLALDQDPLGRPAVPRCKDSSIQVWVKELADGHRALGIFNQGEETATYTLDFAKAGLPSSVRLRDLWRQRDLGRVQHRHTMKIPGHGVVLLKALVQAKSVPPAFLAPNRLRSEMKQSHVEGK